MNFQFIQTVDAKTWSNKRYMVQVEHMGHNRAQFIIFVAVCDKGDGGEYTPIYPRFEADGKTMDEATYHAGGIAEALVREMRKLKEDAPLSKVKKLLRAVSRLLTKTYGLGDSDGRTRTQIIVP